VMETTKRIFKVDREDIHYLRTTIESYDGMAVVRTVDPGEATIELLIAPGCEDLVSRLLAALREKERIRLEPVGIGIEQRAKSIEWELLGLMLWKSFLDEPGLCFGNYEMDGEGQSGRHSLSSHHD